jgi:hypothetical protein
MEGLQVLPVAPDVLQVRKEEGEHTFTRLFFILFFSLFSKTSLYA